MKNKITIKEWHYECGEKCCHEYGWEYKVNGKVVYSGPQEENAILAILNHFGIEATIVGLDSETEEEIWEL